MTKGVEKGSEERNKIILDSLRTKVFIEKYEIMEMFKYKDDIDMKKINSKFVDCLSQ